METMQSSAGSWLGLYDQAEGAAGRGHSFGWEGAVDGGRLATRWRQQETVEISLENVPGGWRSSRQAVVTLLMETLGVATDQPCGSGVRSL